MGNFLFLITSHPEIWENFFWQNIINFFSTAFFFFNLLDLWQKSSTQKNEKIFGKILNFLDFGLGSSIPKYKKKLFLKKYEEFTQGCYAIYFIFFDLEQ